MADANLKNSGAVPTDLVFTNKSWRAFRLDTTIKDNAITFPNMNPYNNQINPGAQINKGAVYKGRWGNFDLWLYNDWYIDPTDNVEKPMIPDGAVIMSGADLMGTRAFGVILIRSSTMVRWLMRPRVGLKRTQHNVSS